MKSMQRARAGRRERLRLKVIVLLMGMSALGLHAPCCTSMCMLLTEPRHRHWEMSVTPNSTLLF